MTDKQVSRQTKKARKQTKKAEKAETKALVASNKALAAVARTEASTQASRNAATLVPVLKALKAFSTKPTVHPDVIKYLQALIDPESFFRNQMEARVPDDYSVPTACLASFSTYDVVGNFNPDSAGSDLGRFCYVATPTMAQTAWIRIGGETGQEYGVTNGTVTYYGNQLTLGANVAFLEPGFRWEPATAMQTYVPGPLQRAGKGKYRHVDITEPSKVTKHSSMDASKLDLTNVTLRDIQTVAKQCKCTLDLSYAALKKSEGDVVAAVLLIKDGFVPEAPPIIISQNSWNFFPDPNCEAIGGTQGGVAIGGVTSVFYSGGAAESIRPVGMSVWFEASMSTIANGGRVAIALLPPNSMLGQIAPYNFTSATTGTAQWSGQGPLENVENLGRVPGAYSGPLKTGAYCYWVPSRLSDVDMKTVVDNLTTDFPTIVLAGQTQGFPGVQDGSSETVFNGVLGQVRVCTLYEYTTTDQTRPTKRSSCIPGVHEVVKCALKDAPRAMANGKHKGWIDKVLVGAAGLLGGVGGFLVGGPPGAVAAGTAAAGAMSAVL